MNARKYLALLASAFILAVPFTQAGAADSGFYLGGSVGIDDRRDWERALIEEYRMHLERGGASLGASLGSATIPCRRWATSRAPSPAKPCPGTP